MRPTLLVKYAVSYILIIVIALFIFNTYGLGRIRKSLTVQRLDVLQNEASVISEAYVNSYYSGNVPLTNVVAQLKTIDILANARIWIVSKDRYITFDSRSSMSLGTQLTEDFLAADTSEYVQVDNLINDPMLSVVYPVYNNWVLSGYIVLLSPVSEIDKASIYYANTINICFLLVAFVLFIFLLFLYLISIVPLKRTIAAARQYADGHFNYKSKITDTHDEFYDLSTTIEYMAGELQKNEDYQHKFISNISHDFRSPLTSIKGYTEAMLDGTIPPEMHEKYLNTINFEIERLTKLTSGILDLNNFDSNSIRLDITDFDINSIIKKTAEVFEGSCLKKRITLRLTFSGTVSMVRADQGRIQQVLYNLLDNAIKFSHHDSFIDISVKEKNNKYFVSVKDHGSGIPKESIGKIFDRFYKSDSSRGKDKKGTGLGLSIVKEIINMHGENINVVSTEGVGTEFTFSIAKAPEAEEED